MSTRPLCYEVEYMGHFGEEFVDTRWPQVLIWIDRLFLTVRRYR